jgi:hypothetical protein
MTNSRAAAHPGGISEPEVYRTGRWSLGMQQE